MRVGKERAAEPACTWPGQESAAAAGESAAAAGESAAAAASAAAEQRQRRETHGPNLTPKKARACTQWSRRPGSSAGHLMVGGNLPPPPLPSQWARTVPTEQTFRVRVQGEKGYVACKFSAARSTGILMCASLRPPVNTPGPARAADQPRNRGHEPVVDTRRLEPTPSGCLSRWCT